MGPATPAWLRDSSMSTALYRRRRLCFVAVVIIVLLLTLTTDPRSRESRIYRLISPNSEFNNKAVFPPLQQGCPANSAPPRTGFPYELLEDVQIVMKTGVGAKARTETFLKTYGAPIENVLIFSDAEYDVGRFRAVDLLATLPASYAVNNTDWDVYLSQQKALAAGQRIDQSHDGWKLDRFKFLPMVEQAFALRPNAKWYVFLEGDVYYFWDTLFRVLARLDPDRRHYLGAPTPGAHDRWFAYGGAGTVLSGRLVRDLLRDGKYKLTAQDQYEKWQRDDCCGDAVLAYVIYAELGHRVESMYPTWTGEAVQWLPTGPERLCTPLLALHRVGSEQMEGLWEWDRCRPYTEAPITHASILDFTLAPLLGDSGSRKRWNNGADIEQPEDSLAHQGVEYCAAACAFDSSCLQWKYEELSCFFGQVVMAGEQENDEKKGVTSGWNLRALKRLGYDPKSLSPGSYCSRINWLSPKTMAP